MKIGLLFSLILLYISSSTSVKNVVSIELTQNLSSNQKNAFDGILDICIIGSAAGVNDGASTETLSMIGLLQTRLVSDGINFRISNFTTTGQTSNNTTSGNSNGIDQVPPDTDILIISLPNDDLAIGIPISETIANIQSIVDIATANNIQVLIMDAYPRGYLQEYK